MPYYDKLRGTRVVELSEGYWAKLRHLTTREATSISEEGDPKTVGVRGVVSAIVAWNLDDENGVVAISEESVMGMAQGDFARLVEAMGDMEGITTGLTDAVQEAVRRREKARFPGGAQGSDLNGKAGTSGSPEVSAEEGVVGKPGSNS